MCASRRARDLADLRHGTASTRDQGCRCAACVAAHTTKTLSQRKRKNAASRDMAEKNGQPWTGADVLPLARGVAQLQA
jgi:hypothetical protein